MSTVVSGVLVVCSGANGPIPVWADRANLRVGAGYGWADLTRPKLGTFNRTATDRYGPRVRQTCQMACVQDRSCRSRQVTMVQDRQERESSLRHGAATLALAAADIKTVQGLVPAVLVQPHSEPVRPRRARPRPSSRRSRCRYRPEAPTRWRLPERNLTRPFLGEQR